MKSYFKKHYPLLLSFMLPVVIMLVILIGNHVYPFGNRCMLRSDMYNQYVPFFKNFYMKLHNGDSLLYSWDLGMGSNFIAMYAYYLSSPFNWLLFLCPENYLIEFMTLLIVGKIGLCGFSFAFYLNRHFGKNDISITMFSLFYSLSGFIAAYNWDIMWLDVVFLAPLVILGLERLIKEKKCDLYLITLSIAIISNYYLSIMLCIFLVLYFVILVLYLPWKEKFQAAFRFGVFSLLSAGCAALMLGPAAAALTETKYDNVNFPTNFKFYFNVLEELSRHCINIESELALNHWPNIYCGVIILILIPLYLLNKNIKWKEKIPKLLLAAFFVLSFNLNALAYIWHGLNYPNSLPARQSYLYIFWILIICYEGFLHLKENKMLTLSICSLVALAFVGACALFTDTEAASTMSYVLTALFLILYLWLMLWYKKCNRTKSILIAVTLFVVVSEVGINMALISIPTTNRNAYLEDSSSYQTLLADLKAEDQDFYRIEKFTRKTKNDGMFDGYQTATMFSSTTGERMETLYKRLGLGSSKVFYSFQGATPLVSALFSIKYMFSDATDEQNSLYTPIGKDGDITLYKNTYNLPVGYMVSDSLDKRWKYEDYTGIYSQIELGNQLGVDTPLFEAIQGTKVDEHHAIITVKESGYIYASLGDNAIKKLYVTINDEEETFKDVKYDYILDLGFCPAGTEIKLESKDSDANIPMIDAFRLNKDSLEQAVDILSEQTLENVKYDTTSLQGTIDVKEKGKLVLTVPYEYGWTLYVDGVKREKEMFADALLAVHLDEGKHTIYMEFEPVGLWPGVLASLICIVIACGILRKKAIR